MGTFENDPAAPDLAQAASLALALMRATKAKTWAAVVANPAPLAEFVIDPELAVLLNRFGGELTHLVIGPPLVTLAVCPACARWAIVSGQPATTCPMTLGCGGKPVKASIATRVKVQVEPEAVPEDLFGSVDGVEPAVVEVRVSVDVTAPHIYPS